jgi:secernin
MDPTSCDTMVALGLVTAHGQTLFAKNSDRPADECQPLILHPRRSHAVGARTRCQFVDLPEVAVTYRHIGSRPYWCWGYEHGFNEHQVVIGNEALPSRLPEAAEAKLVGMELIRLGLERSRTAAEAVQVITDLIGQYGQGKFANNAGIRTYDNGYIVADPLEAYIIETAGHQWAVKQVAKAVGISNVYSLGSDWDSLSPGAQADALARGWAPGEGGRFDFAATYADPDSWGGSGSGRRARSCALLDWRLAEIDAAAMMGILSDHGDEQMSADSFHTKINVKRPAICMHPDQDNTWGNTAASLVADLCADGSRLPVYWCSFYSPCLGFFLPIFIDGDLPEALTIGGAAPDEPSPWWLFHRLAHLARVEPESRVPQVRETWAPRQADLLESAYAVAGEGRRLLDGGRSDAARELLTGYMMENTATMLEMASQMVDEFEKQSTLQNEDPQGVLS